MNTTFCRALLLVVLGCGTLRLSAQTGVVNETFIRFIGTTPCGEPIRRLFRISSDPEPEIMQWKLTLYEDPKTQAPSRYDLQCHYGLTAPNKPGIARNIKTLERQGTWTIRKGANANTTLYDLEGAVSFFQVSSNILHVIDPDRTLILGTSGWSYTLNRAENVEKSVDPSSAGSPPEMSYRISALATGPSVFGVFEGRTPCQGIARELKISVPAGALKSKWRVTLYQDPESRKPTTYKVEGSLHRGEAREGNWNIVRGSKNDPNAIVYRLESAKAGPALLLLKGDENVLFFLDQNESPLVGNSDFSYTLNRRSSFSPAYRPVRLEEKASPRP